MYTFLLQSVGLTENEAKVYVALLKMGSVTSSKVVSEAEISGGKVYETLDRLYRKGFVSLSNVNGVKHFAATKPQAILQYLNEQKKELERKEEEVLRILPELISLRKEEPFFSELLIGDRGVKVLIQSLFASCTSEILAMGVRGDKDKKYNRFWWHLTNEFNRKGKHAKYLFIENKSEYFKDHLALEHVEVRSILTLSPAAIDIIDDHVLLLTYEEKELHCVHIHSPPIAKSFRSFFQTLWKLGK